MAGSREPFHTVSGTVAPTVASGHVAASKVRIPRSSGQAFARLDELLSPALRHRLTLVVAPAGAGKTTLLARFAQNASVPVAWYRADPWDRSPVRLLRHLESAFASIVPGLTGGWETIDDAVAALDAAVTAPMLLVIDDLHTLERSPAAASLERLLDMMPPGVATLAAGRSRPDMNLPRLRVAGDLLEISPDDLRLRSWEVDRLFRDHYGSTLPPEDLALLARRTEGWAAGLQLFHLATAGRSAAERRRVLDGLGPSSRLMRDYLTRNVLAELPPDLRAFLSGTAVLGRLTGPLCDALLDRSGSAGVLLELEDRCLFTLALPEPGHYRYHEVFRSHLLGALSDEVGEGATRARSHRAGELLAAAGALPEALDAFCRAGSWRSVEAILGRDGGILADHPGAWLATIPESVLRLDPWLLLARARMLRGEGRLAAAAAAYETASDAFGSADGARVAAEERAAILPWLDARPPHRTGPSARLRAGTLHDPARAILGARPDASMGDRLVDGLLLILAGSIADGRAALLDLAETSTDDGPEVAIARVAAVAAGLLRGPDGVPREDLRHEATLALAAAEANGLDWLARLGGRLLPLLSADEALLAAEPEPATAHRRRTPSSADADGDAWGPALAELVTAWVAPPVRSDGPQDTGSRLESVALAFRASGLPVLEAWAQALRALAVAVPDGDGDAARIAIAAEATARSTGVPVVRAVAQLALGVARGAAGRELREDAEGQLVPAGLGRPAWLAAGGSDERDGRGSLDGGAGPAATPSVAAAPWEARLAVHAFGTFSIVVDGAPVDLGAVRPRVRSLLRYLAAHAGEPVHQEVIEETFWPGADPVTAAQNLHTAVASARRLLEPATRRDRFRLVVREGATYRLSLPAGSWCDLRRFDEAVERARLARTTGDAGELERWAGAALDLHRGDLLADEGPADWVLPLRERRRLQALEAAEALASLLMARGATDGAARACEQGLALDRFHDPLWRRLIALRERAGDAGAAHRIRGQYREMLREMGVEAPG